MVLTGISLRNQTPASLPTYNKGQLINSFIGHFPSFIKRFDILRNIVLVNSTRQLHSWNSNSRQDSLFDSEELDIKEKEM